MRFSDTGEATRATRIEMSSIFEQDFDRPKGGFPFVNIGEVVRIPIPGVHLVEDHPEPIPGRLLRHDLLFHARFVFRIENRVGEVGLLPDQLPRVMGVVPNRHREGVRLEFDRFFDRLFVHFSSVSPGVPRELALRASSRASMRVPSV